MICNVQQYQYYAHTHNGGNPTTDREYNAMTRALYADYRVQNPQSCQRQDWLIDQFAPLNAQRNQRGRANVGTKSMPEPLPWLRGHPVEHTLPAASPNEAQHSTQIACAPTTPRREGHQWWFALDSFPTSTHRHCLSCRVFKSEL